MQVFCDDGPTPIDSIHTNSQAHDFVSAGTHALEDDFLPKLRRMGHNPKVIHPQVHSRRYRLQSTLTTAAHFLVVDQPTTVHCVNFCTQGAHFVKPPHWSRLLAQAKSVENGILSRLP